MAGAGDDPMRRPTAIWAERSWQNMTGTVYSLPVGWHSIVYVTHGRDAGRASVYDIQIEIIHWLQNVAHGAHSRCDGVGRRRCRQLTLEQHPNIADVCHGVHAGACPRFDAADAHVVAKTKRRVIARVIVRCGSVLLVRAPRRTPSSVRRARAPDRGTCRRCTHARTHAHQFPPWRAVFRLR